MKQAFLNFDCKFALCLECLRNSFFTLNFKLSSTSSHESATFSYQWFKTLPELLEFLHDLEAALNLTRGWETKSQLSHFQLDFVGGVFCETLLEASMENVTFSSRVRKFICEDTSCPRPFLLGTERMSLSPFCVGHW